PRHGRRSPNDRALHRRHGDRSERQDALPDAAIDGVINWPLRGPACDRASAHITAGAASSRGATTNNPGEETDMRKPLHFVFTLALASAVGAPVLAQQAEYTPDVANCSDPSYENAVKNGITLGSNDNPPEFYQDANKEPAGIDWEINK